MLRACASRLSSRARGAQMVPEDGTVPRRGNLHQQVPSLTHSLLLSLVSPSTVQFGSLL